MSAKCMPNIILSCSPMVASRGFNKMATVQTLILISYHIIKTLLKGKKQCARVFLKADLPI